jgi:hypothetical protein
VASAGTNDSTVPVHEEPRHRLVHESGGLRLLEKSDQGRECR